MPRVQHNEDRSEIERLRAQIRSGHEQSEYDREINTKLRMAAGMAASSLSRHLSHQLSYQNSYTELRAARDGLVAALGNQQSPSTEKP